MDFADQTVLALADPQLRAGLLDQDALQAILTSAQDGPALATTGPFSATFDTLELGPDLGGLAATGAWAAVDGSARSVGDFTLSGLHDPASPAVAAVWMGTITANTITGDARVSAVSDTWSAGSGEEFQSATTVTLVPSAPAAPAATTFALAAAVFVADSPIALLDLLRASARARAQVATARPSVTPAGVIATTLPIAVWLVNPVVFDDGAWPGAASGSSAADARVARRDRAAPWLAAQHIGLAVVS